MLAAMVATDLGRELFVAPPPVHRLPVRAHEIFRQAVQRRTDPRQPIHELGVLELEPGDELVALVVEGNAARAATGVATAQGAAEHALRRSLRAAEQERHRWARELHDQTLQDLAGLRLTFDALAEMDDRSEMDPVIERARVRIRDAIAQLRHLVAELRPLSLDDLGVAAALRALAAQVTSSSTAAVSVDVNLPYESGADARPSPEVEEATYRVVQESLNNAVKHAEAQTIRVSVAQRDDNVVIEVADDGIGFDPDARHEGFGLIGMRERLQLVGGTLRLEARPGGGTTVRAVIPAARTSSNGVVARRN